MIIIEYLNTIINLLFIIVDTIFWGSISLTSIIYSPSGRVAHWCMQSWSRSILWFCRTDLRVEGLENVALDHVQIFAASHTSYFDIFILSAVLPVRFGWVAKKPLFRIPFLGWHMKLQGYIAIDRKAPKKAIESLNSASEKIQGGNRIAIFPEGTRSRKGNLLPFKKGLFHLCIQTGVPMVPVYINGSYDIHKPGSLFIRSGTTVHVKIGNEMNTRHYSKDQIDDIMGDLRERMLALTA